MSKGVLYVGTNVEFFEESIESVETLYENNDINASVITTEQVLRKNPNHPFEETIILTNPKDDLRDKIFNLDRTPYNKTLFLDGDTTIVGDISPVYDLLDRVDIAASRSSSHPSVSISGIPDCFPEMNTGVIAYNNSQSVFKLFRNWKENLNKQLENGRPNDTIPYREGNTLEEAGGRWDRMYGQPPFREALFTTDVTFSILTSEYNFRRSGAFAYPKVKIIHDKNRKKLAPIINENEGEKRIYWREKILLKNGESYSLYQSVPFLSSKANAKLSIMKEQAERLMGYLLK